MPVAETRKSNSPWVGRYGASSDHKNEIPPSYLDYNDIRPLYKN